mmetsp:Transcript_8547/g.13547  ORF Transcript_8547/g.13547 Transcript_8547/m.13547 type:complete len:262 (-) Transcript_8547:584-1369(-)
MHRALAVCSASRASCPVYASGSVRGFVSRTSGSSPSVQLPSRSTASSTCAHPRRGTMAGDLDSSRSRVIGEEVGYGTKWLAFKHLTYVDPTGRERKWDMVGRATRAEGAAADAVCIFATLRKEGEEDTMLLVRQFRPPMRGETIELPAGLIDGTEPPERAALRELKEETGYVGTVGEGAVTPALPLSPGLTSETVCMVRVDVNLDAPENANPTQALEGSEFITVLRVPKKGLRKQLDTLAGHGYSVFAGLYTMALGMEMNE